MTIPNYAERREPSPFGRIPLGLTAKGEFVWQPDYDPHVLLSGRTRSGKTSLVRTIIKALSEQGAQMALIDPKMVGLMDVEHLPGVMRRVTSRDLDGTAHVIGWVHRQMMGRYELLEEGMDPGSLPRMVLVVDEGRMLYEVLCQHWNSTVKPRLLAEAKASKSPYRPTGKEHPAIEEIRNILRLGGEAKVSVILISQQADASWLSTEARQNLGLRVGLGNLDDSSKGMLFGKGARLAPLPTNDDGTPIKGRAYAALSGDEPVEMQAYFTPAIPRPQRAVQAAPQPVESLVDEPVRTGRSRTGLLARLLGTA